MRRLFGSGFVLVVLAVIVVIALVPLFLVYKSTCGSGDERRTEYNLVLPWNEPPANCRDDMTGFQIVTDAVGL